MHDQEITGRGGSFQQDLKLWIRSKRKLAQLSLLEILIVHVGQRIHVESERLVAVAADGENAIFLLRREA